MKVKILMTKEEAARLLSKCRDGGELEFRDVARELVQIPASRVSVVYSGIGEDRVLGNDLDKKNPTNKLKKRENKVPAEAIVPLLQKEKELEREQSHRPLVGGEERQGMKVKILMTKEEAARLLSKCRDGGVLEFRDVARELEQIPASRVSVVSSGKGEDRVLGSIPEESWTTS
ncbi:hypothetical protein RHSIM_Rhsim02G0243800 [Rhododendron simsii]|uniref:DUF7890 domain-containing protein n=1 Tax=Rhododendron simsii TaxID=118357 RepID=A0A834HAQ7_RHOSS|nr:hypothetical protein RHSIM_Rhsim02G0243800 [Rhododendron simsii]